MMLVSAYDKCYAGVDYCGLNIMTFGIPYLASHFPLLISESTLKSR